MSKNQFYDRVKALQREGDSTFDLLNSLKVPISTRKLLSNGSVKVEADEIIVGEERARLDDPARITEIIKSLANKTVEQTRTIERGKKEIIGVKKKLDDAKKQSFVHPILSDNPHAHALNAVIAALANLRNAAESLPLADAIALRDHAMNQISTQKLLLEEAYRFDGDPTTAEDRALLSDDDVDELSNEM